MASALVEGHGLTESTLLTCTLCNQELKIPKLLPCQHSFCFQCLVRHHDDVVEGKPFCCPTCYKVINLEDNSAESIEILPDNYLFDIARESGECVLYSNLRCSPCNEGGKVSNATHKCLDCSDTLCQHCNEWHCRFTATKHHVVVPLTDLRKRKFQEEYSTRKVLYCDRHSSEERKVPLSSYCDDCRSLVCVECIQGDHKSHGCSNIHTEREKQQSSSNEKITNLQRYARDQEKKVGNIEKAITDTRQKRSQQEAEIYDTATEIYALVDKIKEEKLAELTSRYEKELKHLNDLLEKEKNKQSSLQATVAFTKIFLEKSSDSDFLYHKEDIRTRMESSQKDLSKAFERNVVSVEKREIDSIRQAMEDVIGTIKTDSKCFPHKCRIGPVKERFRRIIDIGEVYGLAYSANDKEIFVIGNKRNERITVLNDDGSSNGRIKCENLEGLSDVHVHLKNNEIYLTTFKQNIRKVFQIGQSGRVRKSVMLPEDDQETNDTVGLVVDDDNNVLIASHEMDRIYKWKQDEDKLSIFLSKEIGHDISGPSDLCLTPTGELVVSNSGSSNIQVYSKEGVFQWRYDGEEEVRALMSPGGICCDEDGYLYVIDEDDCIIHVIHDQKLVGTIPIDEEIEEESYVSLILTPGGDLIYGYDNNLVKISFWDNDDKDL